MTTTAELIAAHQYRTPTTRKNLYNGVALNINSNGAGKTTFTQNWPKGPAIYGLAMTFTFTLTAGTASGPITDGILNYISQILFQGDNNEIFIDNVSARALMMGPSIVQNGTVPNFDQIAATSGTYVVTCRVNFADPRSVRPADTFIDTRRYSSMKLTITLGSLSDLFTNPGTASMTGTISIGVLQSQKDLPKGLTTIGYPSYFFAPYEDVTEQTYIDLVRAEDVWYKRLYIQAASAGGGAWEGPNDDSIVDTVTLSSTDETWENGTVWTDLQNENKDQYNLESVMTGRVVIDFMSDLSNKSALFSMRNNLKLSWVNDAGVAAGDTVSVLCESYRSLRNAA